MPIESTITKSIIAYIKQLGGQAEKVKGDSSSSGRPDINACYKGRCLRIEVKTPDHGNVASKKQKVNLARWRHAGAVTMTVYSKRAVMFFIDCIDKGMTGPVIYEYDKLFSTAYIPEVSAND